MNMVRGFFTVGFWTLMSRLFGFCRDILMAGILGASPIAEAFVVAFSLPNLFRRFFAEGAFNMAFIPMFSKKLESDDEPLTFARDALSMLALVLIILNVIALYFMPYLVWLMASGFSGDARFDITVLFGRIAFPYIFFISLAALLSGVLNSVKRFMAAAAAPILLNLCFIVALFLASRAGWNIGLTLSWSVPLAGIGQFVFLWIAAHRAGFTLIPRLPRLTPELRRLAAIAAPVALAGGVVQVNLLVGRQIASYFDGANAWLYYADRLYQLPLGVVGISVGIVLLPDLSRKLGAGDARGGGESFNRAMEFSLLLTIPSAVALLIIPSAIISVIFERGAFSELDTSATAMATAIYGLGLPAFVLQKIYQPLFFAREDTRSPFYFALVALVVNAVVAVSLRPYFGFLSAAYGATFAGWAMLVCLWWGSRRFGHSAYIEDSLKAKIWRIVLASFMMGACIWLTTYLLSPLLQLAGYRVFTLILIITLGVLSYFIFCRLLGVFTFTELKKKVGL